MPRTVLLDMSVLTDYLAGDAGAGALIEKALSGEVAASVSTMTVLQLWRSRIDDRRAEIRLIALLKFVEQVPVSAEVARIAGQMCSRSGDGPRGDEEVMVAVNVAVSRNLGVPVCTRDARTYQGHDCDVVPY